MSRFYQTYYDEFVSYARDNLGTSSSSFGISERRAPFRDWISKFESWNEEKTPFTDIDNLRKTYNARYSKIVKSLKEKEVNKDLRSTKDVARFVWQVKFSKSVKL
jgi:hypothetical protein